jgi:hypothetical protein
MNDELKLRDEWFTEAKTQTLVTLPAFLEKLVAHPHDYGTICRAIAAAALGAAWAVEHAPCGGITGFQAGCVGWDLLEGWGSPGEKGPKRIQSFANLLYPQYDDRFAQRISPETWTWVREQAAKKLAEHPDGNVVHPDVRVHWQSIADGTPPFGFIVSEEP